MSSEHSNEMLRRGLGHASLHTQPTVPPRQRIKGHVIKEGPLIQPGTSGSAKYLAVEQLIDILVKAGRLLLSYNPHPADQCVVAVLAERVETLLIALVRVPGQNRELEERPMDEVADEEVASLVQPCNVADMIMALNAKTPIDLDSFAREFGQSARPEITLNALKAAMDPSKRIASDRGLLIGRNPRPLVSEIPASTPLIIEGFVQSFDGSNRMSLRLCKSSPPTPFDSLKIETVQLHVPGQHDPFLLAAAKLADAKVRVTVSATYVLPQGRERFGHAKATVMDVDNRAELLTRAQSKIVEQLRLVWMDATD